MILSHKHKFIFVKTQKTAGTSLEIALSKFCGDDDIITPISINDEKIRENLGYRGPQNYKDNSFKSIFKKDKKLFYNHISCKNIKELVGDEIYNSYYKFCFERNPYDKLISFYNHEGGDAAWGSIKKFILNGELSLIKGFDQYTINKLVAVDSIFKYENLEDSLQEISKRIKLSESLSLNSIKAKGNFRKDKRHYSDVLNEEEVSLITTIWAREMSLLGYKF